MKDKQHQGHLLLQNDLLNSPGVLAATQNDQFSIRLYNSIVGATLIKEGVVVKLTPKLAASIVLLLRNVLNPNKHTTPDFLFVENKELRDPEIRDIFNSLGWHYQLNKS
jgi:hypothetical protein